MDADISTLKPQTTDDEFALRLRATEALSRIAHVQSATHGNVATDNGDGSLYTALADIDCEQVTIMNLTGVVIEVQRDGAGVGFPIPNEGAYTFRGLANANELAVRRQDESNTQVTIHFEAEQF